MSSPALKVALLGRPRNPQATVQVAIGPGRGFLGKVLAGGGCMRDLGRSWAPRPTARGRKNDAPWPTRLRTALSVIPALLPLRHGLGTLEKMPRATEQGGGVAGRPLSQVEAFALFQPTRVFLPQTQRHAEAVRPALSDSPSHGDPSFKGRLLGKKPSAGV